MLGENISRKVWRFCDTFIISMGSLIEKKCNLKRFTIISILIVLRNKNRIQKLLSSIRHHHHHPPLWNSKLLEFLGFLSAHVHPFLIFLRRREKKQKRTRKKKRRGRGVMQKSVTNCWDFFGNFIILLGIEPEIWSFQNYQKFQHFWGILLKDVGI